MLGNVYNENSFKEYTMKDENKIYEKLDYFYKTKTKVFFSLYNGGWRKGFILDLNEKMKTLVLGEDVLGEIPILLEEIKPLSIQVARPLIDPESRIVRGDKEW